MSKEYLGIDAVLDLFDIVYENYVSREEFEEREKKIASAINTSSALIAASILKAAEVIAIAKGGEGGEGVNDIKIATESEIQEVLNQYFGETQTEIVDNPASSVDSNIVATDDEVNDALDKYFN